MRDKWNEDYQRYYEAVQRDEKDFVAVIAHTGGQAIVMSSSELTVMATICGIMGKLLKSDGPLRLAVMTHIANLPEDAPEGFVEGILLKNLQSLSRKYHHLGVGLGMNREMGIAAGAPDGSGRYGTFRDTTAHLGDEPSGDHHHENQSQHAERGHGGVDAQRSDPNAPQHEPGKPANPAEPQPAAPG